MKNRSLCSNRQTFEARLEVLGWEDRKLSPLTTTSTAESRTELLDEPCATWSGFLETRSARSAAREIPVLSGCDLGLHRAAAGGDVEACRHFLADGADLGAQDKHGAAALHFAA